MKTIKTLKKSFDFFGTKYNINIKFNFVKGSIYSNVIFACLCALLLYIVLK